MDTNEEQQFTCAMQLVTSSSLTMVLVTSIKLKVLEAIADAGSHAQLSAQDIASRLSISNPHASDMLDRMLHLLASHSVVTCSQRVNESKPVRVYGLAPVAKYFVPNENGVSLAPLMEFAHSEEFTSSWFELPNCVVKGGRPFEKVHGSNAFEYPARNATFNELFNKSMVHHSTIVIKEVLRRYEGLFDNLKCVVDVSGGLGITINMIVSKYPHIKGINYDLPHVIQHAPLYPGIEHVGGDMFQNVPKADAIFMKWILHDWSDERCETLLKNCYKALQHDGKVIVVDAVLPFTPDETSSVQVNGKIDAILMTQYPGGKERTEDEFLALAKCAGFSGINKKCFVYNYWVMEFYK